MKKLFIPLALIMSNSIFAIGQQVEMWSNVPVLIDGYAHKVAPDGSFTSGEAVAVESVWGRDNITGEIFLFDNASSGDGNSISKDHIMVGTDKTYMKGALLVPGEGSKPKIIPSLEKYNESYVHGINWNGTRLVGFMANTSDVDIDETDPDKQKMSYLPFYCDIVPETLEVSDPVFLPVPIKDFFGLVPQYCTAFWISDDATVILGQVIDNSGAFIYPIVYKQSANGEWSYSLPSEKLFNPNGLEIPKWPTLAIPQPLPQDYIGNPEFKALFEQMLNAYINGESYDNPYLMLNPIEAGPDALMTMSEWEHYQEALMEYEIYYNTEYQEELNKYYDDFSRFIAQSSNFLQSSMTMNRAGTMIGQSKITTRFSGITPITYLNPVVFNLVDDSYQIYGGDYDEIEVNQILPDNTLVGFTMAPGASSPDLTPQHSYVCPPGSKAFIKIEEYLKDSNPEYYQWMDEYLRHEVPIGYDESGKLKYIDITVTGMVSTSDDFSFLAGAVDSWSWNLNYGNYFTYMFNNVVKPQAGVQSVELENNSSFTVFNLQGIKVLETVDKSSINLLSPGVYIVNGKKIMVK